jgi:glutaminyl-tRNA synthetase
VPDGLDWTANLNSQSLERLTDCYVEPFLTNAKAGERYQFERLGYFCVDSVDSSPGHLVFNRAVTLRDTWAKIEKSGRRR